MILPIWAGGSSAKSRAQRLWLSAHRAKSLKILERCRLGLGYLISVEVKCRHRAAKGQLHQDQTSRTCGVQKQIRRHLWLCARLTPRQSTLVPMQSLFSSNLGIIAK